MRRSKYFLSLLFCTRIILTACNFSVNQTIHIQDDETKHSSINTVNGNIIIGNRCDIQGKCRSVNGNIDVGHDSRVKELQTVNGGIRIDSDTIVKRDVESVNGSVTCESGVAVKGDISTINGRVKLCNSEVSHDITTINGDITLKEKSIVRGDIVIKDNKGRSKSKRALEIRLSNESVVEGDIIVKDRDIKVEVYLSDGSKVLGRVRNAEVIEEKIEEGAF